MVVEFADPPLVPWPPPRGRKKTHQTVGQVAGRVAGVEVCETCGAAKSPESVAAARLKAATRKAAEAARRRGPGGRDESSYEAGGEVERRAVATYFDLARVLYQERADQRISLRTAAARAGVSTSRLVALESGSAWPRWATLQAVAKVCGLELHIDGDPKVPHHLIRHVRRTPGLRVRYVAYSAGVRRDTLAGFDRDNASPSSRCVLAVAAELDLKVRLRPIPKTEPQTEPQTGTPTGTQAQAPVEAPVEAQIGTTSETGAQ